MIESSEKQTMQTLLIVDDVPDNLVLLGNMLKDKYKILVAESGEKALKIMESGKIPDLILLDIMMPGMDGFNVCRIIKNNKNLQEIPVIFISALNDINDIVKGFEAGGIDYIVKPFQLAEVQVRINTHLALKKSKIELQSLLSGTLAGSIGVMMDLLTISNPMLVERSNRIRHYAMELNKIILFNQYDSWIVELAIMLSHIGCIGISKDIIEKKFKGIELNNIETSVFENYPEIGAGLLSKIPRLEKVSEIIKNQLIHPSKLKYAQSDIVYIGSAILNILIEYDFMIMKGIDPLKALQKIKNEIPVYPFGLVNHLEEIINSEFYEHYKKVPIHTLREGMILKEDLLSKANIVLIPKGTELTGSLIQLIDVFLKIGNCARSDIDIFIKN